MDRYPFKDVCDITLIFDERERGYEKGEEWEQGIEKEGLKKEILEGG